MLVTMRGATRIQFRTLRAWPLSAVHGVLESEEEDGKKLVEERTASFGQ
jgi:hypothetical protein